MPEITRRTLMGGAAALGASAILPFTASAQNVKRRFRFVHMTDLHIQPELGAADGVALAVKKILTLRPRPDFVITGGDHVMDVLDVPRERADLQFRLLAEALKPLEMPVYQTVGNHDVFGWGASNETARREPDYGKKMFAEKVARSQTYYGFDGGAWRFLVLDSIQPQAGGWVAGVDDTQLQWLKSELGRVGKTRPIVIVSHVPLMTLFNQYATGTTAPTSPGLIVPNGKEVRDLFAPYNVKAVLQGHTHVVEDCLYTGTRFITGGAVCGEWWKGPRLGVHPEGFGVFDVDGDRLTWEYVSYGWKARA